MHGPQPIAETLRREFGAFVLERYPFAATSAREALAAATGAAPVLASGIDRLRDPFAREFRTRLQRLAPIDLSEPTPGVSAKVRFEQAIEDIVEACDGFLRRAAIRVSLTPEERLEILRGMRPHFRRLISIEMSPEIHDSARRRFAGDPRIEILLGNSAVVLPRVLEQIREPAVFWLDGHFMGGSTARASEDTPVRHELSALLTHPVRRHLVLIDDARLFDGTAGYPTISELREWIQSERPGSEMRVEDDIIRCAFDGDGV